MTKYYAKSLFTGWQEVTAEQQQRFIEHIRKYATALSGDKKEEYIKTRVRIER